jgi:hypothetical protein
MRKGNAQVRRMACKALAKFLRQLIYAKKRIEVLKSMKEGYLKSNNFQSRMVYIDFCSDCCALYSRNYIRANFVPEIFDLSNDKVANVRLKLVSELINIRSSILPGDIDNQQRLYDTLDNLARDSDREVKEVRIHICIRG